MNLRPYPKYKPSSVWWLGDVPEHWEVRRLKDRTIVVGGQSPSSDSVSNDSDGLPFLQGNAEFGIRHPVATKSCDEAPRKAQPGDILLSVRAPVGALNVADQPYGIGRGLVAIRSQPTMVQCSFLFYFAVVARVQLHAVATGSTYDAVSVADIGSLPLACPDYEEQTRIGAYLDTEVARMDLLAQENGRLIERLREKRIALVTQAVTRGLPPEEARVAGFDPAPPLRASGVEWLGDIPAHWEVKRLGHLLTRNDGGVWGEGTDRDGTIVLRSTEQTVGGGWRIEEPAVRLLSETDRANCRLMAGDLVVTKSSGSARHIGKSSLVTGEVEKLEACFSNFMQRLRCANSLEPRFAHYLLNCPAGRRQLVFLSNTTTGLANLNGSVLGAIRLACPPDIGEQRAIADYLDRETAKLDGLIGKVETAIERLREYRSALITAVVTGKVDVRGASGGRGRAEPG